MKVKGVTQKALKLGQAGQGVVSFFGESISE